MLLQNVLNYTEIHLWPLFIDGVHPPEGYSHFEEAVYFLSLSSQKSQILIFSTLEGWKAELTLEPPITMESYKTIVCIDFVNVT